MREDSFDSDHRSCSLYTDVRPLSYNGYRVDLGKKTDLSTRKALSDQIMLALANPMSNKNSKNHKILMLQSHLSFLRCAVQFIKQGQNKCEGKNVIAKALSGY